jgi:hypothetical protein
MSKTTSKCNFMKSVFQMETIIWQMAAWVFFLWNLLNLHLNLWEIFLAHFKISCKLNMTWFPFSFTCVRNENVRNILTVWISVQRKCQLWNLLSNWINFVRMLLRKTKIEVLCCFYFFILFFTLILFQASNRGFHDFQVNAFLTILPQYVYYVIELEKIWQTNTKC